MGRRLRSTRALFDIVPDNGGSLNHSIMGTHVAQQPEARTGSPKSSGTVPALATWNRSRCYFLISLPSFCTALPIFRFAVPRPSRIVPAS